MLKAHHMTTTYVRLVSEPIADEIPVAANLLTDSDKYLPVPTAHFGRYEAYRLIMTQDGTTFGWSPSANWYSMLSW